MQNEKKEQHAKNSKQTQNGTVPAVQDAKPTVDPSALNRNESYHTQVQDKSEHKNK